MFFKASLAALKLNILDKREIKTTLKFKTIINCGYFTGMFIWVYYSVVFALMLKIIKKKSKCKLLLRIVSRSFKILMCHYWEFFFYIYIYCMCVVIIISFSKNNHSAKGITIVNNLIVPKIISALSWWQIRSTYK